MPDKPLPPMKYDEKGRALYMPECVLKWHRKKVRRYREAARVRSGEYGRFMGETEVSEDVLTGEEWIRIFETSKKQMINAKGYNHDYVPERLKNTVIDAVIASMTTEDWAESVKNFKTALHRKPTANETLEEQEVRIRTMAVAFDRVIRTFEVALKAEGGKFAQQPASQTVNLTQINLAGELEKNPDLVKLLLHQAKKQGLLEKVENQDETSQGTDAGA